MTEMKNIDLFSSDLIKENDDDRSFVIFSVKFFRQPPNPGYRTVVSRAKQITEETDKWTCMFTNLKAHDESRFKDDNEFLRGHFLLEDAFININVGDTLYIFEGFKLVGETKIISIQRRKEHNVSNMH